MKGNLKSKHSIRNVIPGKMPLYHLRYGKIVLYLTQQTGTSILNEVKSE